LAILLNFKNNFMALMAKRILYFKEMLANVIEFLVCSKNVKKCILMLEF